MPEKVTIPAGTKYGRLTVLREDAERSSDGKIRWVCQCDCGNIRSVVTYCLRSGHTKSCGCWKNELAGNRTRTHGLSKSIPEYQVWGSMLKRCRNPNDAAYSRYGGRGITVDPRWLRFENFIADMGRRPSDEHSIDRIDNDGPYSPDNCRWVTAAMQNQNTRATTRLTHDGKTMTLEEWSRHSGIVKSTIQKRIANGWSVALAVTTPSRKSQ